MSTTAPHIFFHDEMYDAQFARTLTAINAGMADLGEAFATAAQLGHKPTADEWHDAWRTRADRTAAVADGSEATVTRGGALLRASEYYRQAYFFLRHDLTDQRLLDAYARHVATFRAAVERPTSTPRS